MVVLALLEIYFMANDKTSEKSADGDAIRWIRMLRWLRALGSDGYSLWFGTDKVKVGLTSDSCMKYFFNDRVLQDYLLTTTNFTS